MPGVCRGSPAARASGPVAANLPRPEAVREAMGDGPPRAARTAATTPLPSEVCSGPVGATHRPGRTSGPLCGALGSLAASGPASLRSLHRLPGCEEKSISVLVHGVGLGCCGFLFPLHWILLIINPLVFLEVRT